MSRSSEYPIEEIIRDYESGYSFTKLREKYGISEGSAWRINKEEVGKNKKWK